MKPIFYPLTALALAAALFLPAPVLAGPEIAGPGGNPDRRVIRQATAQSANRYQIAPDAVYAVPKPAGITHVYGTRRYAGRAYLIVPGQWYPPVWEDPCTVKRTCVIPGVAPWPGVRVDVNSDEIELAPVGPPPVPVLCGPPAPPRR